MDHYEPQTWPIADAAVVSSSDYGRAVELLREDLSDPSYVPPSQHVHATTSYLAFPSVGIGSGGYIFDRKTQVLHPIGSGQGDECQVWMIRHGLDRSQEDSIVTVINVHDVDATRALLREMLNPRVFWNEVSRRLDSPPVVLPELWSLAWYSQLYDAIVEGAFDFKVRRVDREVVFKVGRREGEVQQTIADCSVGLRPPSRAGS